MSRECRIQPFVEVKAYYIQSRADGVRHAAGSKRRRACHGCGIQCRFKPLEAIPPARESRSGDDRDRVHRLDPLGGAGGELGVIRGLALPVCAVALGLIVEFPRADAVASSPALALRKRASGAIPYRELSREIGQRFHVQGSRFAILPTPGPGGRSARIAADHRRLEQDVQFARVGCDNKSIQFFPRRRFPGLQVHGAVRLHRAPIDGHECPSQSHRTLPVHVRDF